MLAIKQKAACAKTAKMQNIESTEYYNASHQESKSNRWFSQLLAEARNKAQSKGNIQRAQYLERLLHLSNTLMGGEAA